jgi:hypothetical protein
MKLDVERQLYWALPTRRVGELLDRFVDDALAAMPAGGQLEIVALRTAYGLEIEVADSSDSDERAVWQSEDAVVGRRCGHVGGVEPALRIETMRCPQGGWARIVSVPGPAPMRRAA